MRPVALVPSRRCLGGRLLEFEGLIGREDNPASDALLDRHVPCPAQGREAGSEAHHSRFFLGSWGPGIQLAIRLGKAGWLVGQVR